MPVDSVGIEFLGMVSLIPSPGITEHYKGVGSLDGDYGENGEFFGYLPNEVIENYENEGWNREYGSWINGENELMFPIKGKNNYSPSNQPFLWNYWKIEGDRIEIDSERIDGCTSYGSSQCNWLEYIRTKILSKWDISIESGEIRWSGESVDDVGKMYYENNQQYFEYW